MATDSAIEWTHDTSSPWWGCTKKRTPEGKVRRACALCYAERDDARFRRGGETHWGDDAPRLLQFDTFERQLRKSARKGVQEGRPRRVFIASMSDLFEDRADLVEVRSRVFELLHELDGQIVPLLLTKRPRVAAREASRLGWPPGAWLGVSVEDQAAAEDMIPPALEVEGTAGVFLSMEPLVSGPVDLTRVAWEDGLHLGVLAGAYGRLGCAGWQAKGKRVGWVIAGGESGPRATPTHPFWIRSLRDQCASTGTPFFFKQWGEWLPVGEATPDLISPSTREALVPSRRGSLPKLMYRVGKKLAGATLDGETHRELPAGWLP